MTAYFDAARRRLDTIDHAADVAGEAVMAWEREIVGDSALAAMQPWMPADLRAGLLVAIARSAVTSLSHDVWPSVSEAEELCRLRRLCSDLHSMWHTIGRRGLAETTDDPRSWLTHFRTEGLYAAEALVEQATAPPVPDPTIGT